MLPLTDFFANIDMVAFKKELYREVKMKIVSRPDFVTNEINQKASAMGYALGYALRPMLVRTVPGASMFVSGNAGQPLHTHLEWQRNRLNMYRKCLDLKAQLCHSQESLRFAWPTTGMLFQPWWMKTEYDAPANTRSRVAVALLPALVSDEKKFPLQEGQRCLDYNLVRRDEWVYSRAIVIINDVEGMF